MSDADTENGHVEAEESEARVCDSMVESSPRPAVIMTAPADQIGLPLAGGADELAGDGGRDQQAEDQRQAHQTGGRRGLAERDLEVLRQEDRAAEHGHADQQARDGGQRDGAVAEDGQRDDRLGHPRLHEDRQAASSATPPPTRATLSHDAQSNWLPASEDPDQQRADARDDQERAQPSRSSPHGGRWAACSVRCSSSDRGERERHADEEAPAPAQPRGVHHDAADQRARRRCRRRTPRRR